MSDMDTSHANDRTLLEWTDGELPRADAATVRAHLGACPECRLRLDSISHAGASYLHYHQNILKPSDPPPPLPWADLRPRLRTMERSRTARRATWVGLAAAILVGGFILYRMETPVPVSAAQLLRRAIAAEPPHRASDRIRIRARGRTILRPAIVPAPGRTPGDNDLVALFMAAHYDWDDPLSAHSYAAWRSQLAEESDRVDTSGTVYEIHTRTSSGVLTEAVLTLRAGDLHAVREVMHFRDEDVEITEAAAQVAADTPAAPAPTAERGGVRPVRMAGPAEELEVVAALHRIAADLGDPIEITRNAGTVHVTATGLSPAKEQQVRQALAGLDAVTLQFAEPVAEHLRPNGTPKAAVAAAVRSEAGRRLGEETIEQILDDSEAIMARAFAIRALARRFPTDAQAQLSAAGRGVLAGIRDEHTSILAARLDDLKSHLAPILPASTPSAPLPASNWQDSGERILAAAQHVDDVLNRMLAGSGESSSPSELAAAIRQLGAELHSIPPGKP